jgi:hypothetical protein
MLTLGGSSMKIKQKEIVARLTRMHEKAIRKASGTSANMQTEARFAGSRTGSRTHEKKAA